MSDTINGRTPKEIKKGLECCVVKLSCEGCPYNVGDPSCLGKMRKDLLALINQLQEDKKQLERERDAIEGDFAYLVSCIDIDYLPKACEFCMHYFPGYACYPCKFAWRGVQEEET